MALKRLKCDLSPELTTCLKLADSVRPDCCQIRDRIPSDAECFLRDIGKELKKLYERHQNRFTKRKRIMDLAIPRNPQCRFLPRCSCPFKRTIEIVPADFPMHTRTEQLALPTVRRLLHRRNEAISSGDKIGEGILNRWLRYSLMSLYSRLGNLQPLQKPVIKKKLTAKQKKKREMYIKKLAKPKVPKKQPAPERKAGEVDQRRLKKLSRPKVYLEDVKQEWEITPSMRNYKATDRVKKLAEPVARPNVHTNENPEKVSPNALKYKPSERIKEMSQPLAKHDANLGPADLKDDPFAISPNALKYKISSRMKELAEPKEFENTHIRENPFAISPAALKAKASPRLIELAKPKGS
ncbi:sperm microtubule associated protein 2-like [Drosophila virilis]|uniref:Testicular haploid expressed gene protein-like n=1 Tax=Drosophila virilis TaxID=7244 RepID=B4M0N9_DROVI|nr:uncharacterized protein LOC6631085 [Drosophila virilis]EDW67331.1 uncharacterized protein Dvir_GJ23139 [Drosophila virilis]